MENNFITTGKALLQRAFFSYSVTPQGSYSMLTIFRQLIRKKRIPLGEKDPENWRRFLSDYMVFRLYVARFVLKSYARLYPPLLAMYKGFDDIEKHFPPFLQAEGDPSKKKEDLSLLPSDSAHLYTEKAMETYYETFNRMALKAEKKYDDEGHALKSFTSEALSYLSRKNKVPLYTPIFYFFSTETMAYARYLSESYEKSIPPSFSEEIGNPSYEEDEEEDTFYTTYRLPACITLFVAILIAIVVYKG